MRRLEAQAYHITLAPLVFGAHDATIFARSLIGLIGIPVLLLVQAPAFFSRREEPAGVRADDAVASAAK